MNILLTGGTGYVGSHVALELVSAGHGVVLLDNFDNSTPQTHVSLRRLSGNDLPLFEGDIADGLLLKRILKSADIEAVMHLAAYKSAPESTREPLRYYANNVAGTVRLLERMNDCGVRTLVFSSSAAIYGNASHAACEHHPVHPTSPYGHSKLAIEQVLCDLVSANRGWRCSILRYFNAAGAHPSGLLGDNCTTDEVNLLPSVGQVALGQRSRLAIHGNDYPTPDGTCVRDYLHVVDIARAHVRALDRLVASPSGLAVHNLGTGRGYSVLEVVRAFELACGKPIPLQIAARRAGDPARCVANAARARKELGWTASLGLGRICKDHWRWQSSRSNQMTSLVPS